MSTRGWGGEEDSKIGRLPLAPLLLTVLTIANVLHTPKPGESPYFTLPQVSGTLLGDTIAA